MMEIVDLIQVLILSIVEGVTEFLPVSSTGHLILVSKILGVMQSEFVKSFEIIIQFGAIMAVAFMYRKKLLKDLAIWKKLMVSFLPTAVVGFVFYKKIKQLLLGNEWVTLLALGTGGVLLITIERYWKNKEHQGLVKELSMQRAIGIGICQSLSVIPGISRAAATIVGGMFAGLSRREAAEYSFLLAIPTMAAATGLDLVKTSFMFTPNEYFLLAIGFVGSFVSAYLIVGKFVEFIKTNTFTRFGVYRIFLAVIYGVVVR